MLFILALKGLGNPRTARRANLLGAGGALIAVLAYVLSVQIHNFWLIALAVAVGAVIAVFAARRVQMTQMPQLVAAFNGVGGGAAALVALVEAGHSESPWTLVGRRGDGLIGSVSLTGSFVTFGKLQGIITTRAVTFPGLRVIMVLLVVAAVAAGVALVITGDTLFAFVLWRDRTDPRRSAGAADRRRGRADRDLAAQCLHRTRGRGIRSRSRERAAAHRGHARRRERNHPDDRDGQGHGPHGHGHRVRGVPCARGRRVRERRRDRSARCARWIRMTSRSCSTMRSASSSCRATVLPSRVRTTPRPNSRNCSKSRGVDVVFGIHPVAGRMPGHMNVLLAEANVPYDSLVEMDEVNPRFKTTDLVLVVGANDVVNPAAKTSPGSPIYGMPILTVGDAQQVVFLKRSLNPGFAGIENELFYDPKVSIVLGDAKQTLTKILATVKTNA